MCKSFSMHESQAPQDLGRNLEQLIFGQCLAVEEIALQVSVFAVFHGHVQPTGNLVPTEKLDEVVGILHHRNQLSSRQDASLSMTEVRLGLPCLGRTLLKPPTPLNSVCFLTTCSDLRLGCA